MCNLGQTLSPTGDLWTTQRDNTSSCYPFFLCLRPDVFCRFAVMVVCPLRFFLGITARFLAAGLCGSILLLLTISRTVLAPAWLVCFASPSLVELVQHPIAHCPICADVTRHDEGLLNRLQGETP